MDLLNAILRSSQNNAVQSAGSQLGLDSASTQSLLAQLVPALAGGMKKNVAETGGLEALKNALSKGNHQRYVEDPNALQQRAAVEDGNAILGHLFGSKKVSRQVAANAAQSTGIDASLIKKFLPLAAAAAMGAMSKETNGGSKLAEPKTGGSMLGKLLDSDGDGSVMDDLLSLGKRFL